MHRLLRLSIAIAALLLATPAFAGDTLTLTMSPPPPGTKFVEASSLNLEINVELSMGPGKSINQAFSAKTTKKRDVEVLATEGDVITKAKGEDVDYTETATQSMAPPKKTIKPYVGKTYLLERKSGRLVITDEQGAALAPADSKGLAEDNSSFGKPDGFFSSFPKTFEKGKPVTLSEEIARKMMGEVDSSMKIKSATITFREKTKVGSREAAVFDVNFVIAAAQPPMMMTMKMSGSTVVIINGGWPVEIAMKGPISLTAAKAGADIRGGGSIEVNNTWTYK
jgi:hypothetical protein